MRCIIFPQTSHLSQLPSDSNDSTDDSSSSEDSPNLHERAGSLPNTQLISKPKPTQYCAKQYSLPRRPNPTQPYLPSTSSSGFCSSKDTIYGLRFKRKTRSGSYFAQTETFDQPKKIHRAVEEPRSPSIISLSFSDSSSNSSSLPGISNYRSLLDCDLPAHPEPSSSTKVVEWQRNIITSVDNKISPIKIAKVEIVRWEGNIAMNSENDISPIKIAKVDSIKWPESIAMNPENDVSPIKIAKVDSIKWPENISMNSENDICPIELVKVANTVKLPENTAVNCANDISPIKITKVDSLKWPENIPISTENQTGPLIIANVESLQDSSTTSTVPLPSKPIMLDTDDVVEILSGDEFYEESNAGHSNVENSISLDVKNHSSFQSQVVNSVVYTKSSSHVLKEFRKGMKVSDCDNDLPMVNADVYQTLKRLNKNNPDFNNSDFNNDNGQGGDDCNKDDDGNDTEDEDDEDAGLIFLDSPVYNQTSLENTSKEDKKLEHSEIVISSDSECENEKPGRVDNLKESQKKPLIPSHIHPVQTLSHNRELNIPVNSQNHITNASMFQDLTSLECSKQVLINPLCDEISYVAETSGELVKIQSIKNSLESLRKESINLASVINPKMANTYRTQSTNPISNINTKMDCSSRACDINPASSIKQKAVFSSTSQITNRSLSINPKADDTHSRVQKMNPVLNKKPKMADSSIKQFQDSPSVIKSIVSDSSRKELTNSSSDRFPTCQRRTAGDSLQGITSTRLNSFRKEKSNVLPISQINSIVVEASRTGSVNPSKSMSNLFRKECTNTPINTCKNALEMSRTEILNPVPSKKSTEPSKSDLTMPASQLQKELLVSDHSSSVSTKPLSSPPVAVIKPFNALDEMVSWK